MPKDDPDDVFLVGEDGEIYHVPAEYWKAQQISGETADTLKDNFVRYGVVLADMIDPTTKLRLLSAPSPDFHGPVIPAAFVTCFLVNLQSLRASWKPDIYLHVTKPLVRHGVKPKPKPRPDWKKQKPKPRRPPGPGPKQKK